MALNLNQQLFETIKKSNQSLITFRKEWNGDALSSSLALALILKKLGNKPDVICDKFVAPSNFTFLPQIKEIQPTIQNLRKFIISLDVNKNKINELNYNISENKLNIFITPEQELNKEKLVTAHSHFRYDLIFVLDTPDLESLGEIYDKNIEFFYHTPIINIDHNSLNEQFGQINLLELTSTSTAEILFNFLEALKADIIDEAIATYLLTGIISKTKSFKSGTVTPHTLSIASRLIAQGAKREEIIRNLYQTRSLGTLKLWGRALARLKNDPSCKLVWTLITREDFIASGTSGDKLLDVVDDLIINSRGADVVVLIYESPEEKNKICCLVSSEKNINTLSLAMPFGGQGTRNLSNFCLLNKPLIEAEKEIIGKIKERLTAGK